MKKQPLVYIIIVNYNGHVDTIQCIDSLKTIDYSNCKIIVVDNGSKNNSIDAVKDIYPDEIYIESKENLGFAGGNNLGIELAMQNDADYVLLLNNDTIVEHDFLNYLVECSETDPKVGAVGGKIYYYDEKDTIWYAGAKLNKFTAKTGHIGLNEKDNGKYNKVCETGYITGCLMLVKCSVIKKVGLMDESYFLYYEETDWNVKIKNNGYKLIYCPQSIIYHKVSASTKKVNYVINYYCDRNSIYFIKNNFSIFSGIVVNMYIRLLLLYRLIKSTLKNDRERINITKRTYKAIKSKEMGEFKG